MDENLHYFTLLLFLKVEAGYILEGLYVVLG
jgi:hypothetical protein